MQFADVACALKTQTAIKLAKKPFMVSMGSETSIPHLYREINTARPGKISHSACAGA